MEYSRWQLVYHGIYIPMAQILCIHLYTDNYFETINFTSLVTDFSAQCSSVKIFS